MDDATPGGSTGQLRRSRADFRRDRAQAPEKNELKPWEQTQWCIPKVDWEFVARMEDVLDLYSEADDPYFPSSASTNARFNWSVKFANPFPPCRGSAAQTG